nr:hypothetical protein [Pelodictyon luteolum]
MNGYSSGSGSSTKSGSAFRFLKNVGSCVATALFSMPMCQQSRSCMTLITVRLCSCMTLLNGTVLKRSDYGSGRICSSLRKWSLSAGWPAAWPMI